MLKSTEKALSYFCEKSFARFTAKHLPYILRILGIVIFYTVGIEYYSREEGWSRLDAAYFVTVTSSTVGYGIYHPSSDSTRLFTCFYAPIGILLTLSTVEKIAQDFFITFQDRILENFSRSNSKYSKMLKRTALSVSSLCFALLVGTLYFAYNENWTGIQAFYFVIITMTTIGYGDETVHHDKSKLFLIFFIYACISMWATALQNIRESMLQQRKDVAAAEAGVPPSPMTEPVVVDEARMKFSSLLGNARNTMDTFSRTPLLSLNHSYNSGNEESGRGGQETPERSPIHNNSSGEGGNAASAMAATTRSERLCSEEYNNNDPEMGVDRHWLWNKQSSKLSAPTVAAGDTNIQHASTTQHSRDAADKLRYVLLNLLKSQKLDQQRDIEPLLQAFDAFSSNQSGVTYTANL